MTFDELIAAEGKSRLRPRDEEHRLQCACVRWFSLQFPEFAVLLYAVPNGGRRDAVTGAKLKAEGVVPGVADLCLDVARKGWHGLRIELKTPNGRQSDAQKKWQAAVEAQKYRYEVVRSIEEFISLLSGYLL